MRGRLCAVFAAAVFAGGLMGQATPAVPAHLNIVVVEGDGAINNIRLRTARAPIVQVEDENHRPIAGAAVTFSLAANGGPGAAFRGGTSTFHAVTDASGRVVARGFRPNAIPGSFKINVVASFNGQTATTAITQTNALLSAGAAGAGGAGAGGSASGGAGAGGAAGGGAAGGAAGGGAAAGGAAAGAGAAAGLSTGAIVGIAAGVAAAGAVAAKLATGGKSSTQNNPSATIGAPGTPIFGPGSGARPAIARAVPHAVPGTPSSGASAGSSTDSLILAGAAVGAAAAGWYLEHRAGHRVTLSPGIRFHRVTVGTPARGVFLLHNASKTLVRIESIEEPELIRITPPAALPMVLAPGATAVFRVAFVPPVVGTTSERVKFVLSGAHGWSKTLVRTVEAAAVAAESAEAPSAGTAPAWQ